MFTALVGHVVMSNFLKLEMKKDEKLCSYIKNRIISKINISIHTPTIF